MNVQLIGLAGGSGAGKSWLAARLARRLGADCARLSLDDFYRDRSHLTPARRARVNFDHPRAIDWPLFQAVLRRLAARQPAEAPCYDFSTHCRRPVPRLIQPRPFILVEGLWVWHRPRIRELFALRVFVECPAKIRLARRVKRDTTERGRSEAEVLGRFAGQVEPMQQRFVEPLKRTAHQVLCSPVRASAVAQLERQIRHLSDSKIFSAASRGWGAA